MLDEMTRRNASKFTIFYIYENTKLPFPFFISCNFTFFFNECHAHVLCRHRALIRGKSKVAWNEKWKKQILVFVYMNYGKFWSVSQGHFIKHKPLFSEEWAFLLKKITYFNLNTWTVWLLSPDSNQYVTFVYKRKCISWLKVNFEV